MKTTEVLAPVAFKRTIYLGKVDYNSHGRRNCRVAVEIEVKPAQRIAPYLTIDLLPIPDDAVEVSICGNIWNPRETDIYSGDLEEIARLVPTKRVSRIVEIWRKWHLNGLKGGTRAQENEIAKHTYTYSSQLAYDNWARAILKAAAIQPDGEYSYGSAWLHEIVPPEIVEELRTI